MIRLNLLCVGTLKERYWTEAVAEYAKRISRFASFRCAEVPEKRTVEEEGRELLRKASGYKIAFDLKGDIVTSEDFAGIFQRCLNAGRSEITLFIGGSEGLSEEIKSACDIRVSFGRVTFPHQLMRVIASEQIYRALTIMHNVAYHK